MKIIVNPHKLEIAKEPVNEREIDITKCEFEFDDEITNDYVKEAYFTFEGTTYKQIIINNECSIPYEVLEKKGQVEIGVVAFKTEGAEEIKRYNPSPAFFNTWAGSLKDNAENSEPITPSEMEQFEQALNDGLEEVNGKIEEIDEALIDVNNAIDDVNDAIEEVNNLDLDVNKVEKETTVELTKKDGTTKEVKIYDGVSLQFMWQGTSLGVKTDDMQDYVFVNLQGVQGIPGPQGEPFRIKKTYSSVAEMNADFNNMNYGDYVMIASTVEVEDNAKLYTRGEYAWIFITDFSGAQGIKGETGATPIIHIGTVVSGSEPSVSISGTAENPVFNFVLQPGPQGPRGFQGETGNGIASVVKTSTSGLVDTYTITYTDGTTTTFNITNGKGISSITKISSVGLIDTYRVTFNDGTTFDYEVTNGKDGEVTQAQLDEVQAELDRYKLLENALPHTENETASDYVTLENTAKSPMKVSSTPQTSQETTTGANKLNLADGSATNYGVTVTISNGKVKIKGISNGNYVWIKLTNGIAFKTGTPTIASNPTWFNKNLLSGQNYSFSSFASLNKRLVWLENSSDTITTLIAANASTGTIDLTGKIMSDIAYYCGNLGTEINEEFYLEAVEGTTPATTFEPYTNGIASPSPDYPQEIHRTTGENEVKIINKNWFDKSTMNTRISAYLHDEIYWTYVTDSFSIRCPIKGGKTYTISTDVSSPIFRAAYTKADNIPTQGNPVIVYDIVSLTSTDNPIVLTTPSDAKYIIVQGGASVMPSLIEHLQIEEGTTATSYIEHEGMSYPLSLGNIEYCKIGDYLDEFFKNDSNDPNYDSSLELDRWYLKKNIGKVALDGSENWYRWATNTFYITKITEVRNALSNYYTYNTTATDAGQLNNGEFFIHDSLNNYVVIFKNTGVIDSIDAFKEWLSTHNTTVYYVLTTPQYILLNDTLQQQLNDIDKALSMQDTTNIISTATGENLPFLIKARAVQNISNS